VSIRAAASLLVLRDGPQGMQLLLMRRPERDNDFRSGACVFPGGVLDRGDAELHRWCLGLDDATASARLGLERGGLDYFIAALRECFEEVGLLYVCRPDGDAADVGAHAEALHDWRHRLHQGQATLAQLCAAFDWRLDLRDMAYLAHWLTPVTRPKRFDTRFFVRLALPGQTARPDLGEALELMWLTPDEALDPQRRLKLLNVTQRVLHDIRGFDDARAAFGHALALRGVARVFPRPALDRNGPRFVIESDPAYAEVARLDPDGRGDVRCELEPGDVVQLAPRLWRVSGEAANIYVVTTLTGNEALLLEAGNTDAAQQQALHARWPQAQVAPLADSGEVLTVGHGSSLKLLRHGDAGLTYVLVEESVAIGDPPPLGTNADGVEWLAPRRGFLQRITQR